MTRLPQVKARELIRGIERLGFEFVRQKGSHAFYQNPITGRSTIIPIHGGEDIDRTLLRAILKEIEITPEKFMEMLHGAKKK